MHLTLRIKARLPRFALPIVLSVASCAPATVVDDSKVDEDPPVDAPVREANPVRRDGGRTDQRTGGASGATGGSSGGKGDTGGPLREDGGAPDTTPAVVMDAAVPRAQTVVPVVAVDSLLAIPNEPKVTGTIKLYEPPAMFTTPSPRLEDLAAAKMTFMSDVGIELRGKTTRTFTKKPYSIEIWNAMKTPSPQSFFGMPPEADFALLACWLDRTCLRAALGFELANAMRTPFAGGIMWHPKLEFIEVFLKGQYAGTYNWVERVKRDKHRVNIPAPAADMAAGDITGGYMLRIEWIGRGTITVAGQTYPGDFEVAPSTQTWSYFYPRAEDITEPQKAYLKDWATRFEMAANGPDREDPEKGYRKFIDVKSWVDYMLVRELAREVDSYRISFYMVKLPDSMGGKVHAGPQWDFDRAFGNATYYDANKPTGWSFEGPRRPAKKGEEAATFARNIFLSPTFQKELGCRWKEVRKSVITTANINAHLDKWDKLFAKSQERDEAKYQLAGKSQGGVPTFKAHEAALADLKKWNEDRIAWMDSQLGPKCP